MSGVAGELLQVVAIIIVVIGLGLICLHYLDKYYKKRDSEDS